MTFEQRVSLVELLDTAGLLSASDAASLVIALCRTVADEDAAGVARRQLRANDVWLDRAGRVHLAAGTFPSVLELGHLLEQLLARIREDRPAHFPPGLVMVAARATGRIDMGRLASREALAEALMRFAVPDNDTALRSLYQRVANPGAFERSSSSIRLQPEIVESTSDFPLQPEVAHGRGWRALAAAAIVLSLGAGYAGGWWFVRERGRTQTTDATEVVLPPPVIDARAATPSNPRTPPRAPASSTRGRAVAARNMDTPEPLVDATQAGSDKAFSPSFARDGSAVFFHAETADGSALKRAQPTEDGVLHVVTILNDSAKNYHVQLSPDGKSVAFDSDRDGERGVYVAHSDGTTVQRVSGPGYAAVPTWSPDGRRLAFLRGEADRPNVWNLWLLDLTSGETTRLTRHRYGQVWGGAWFPDGHRLAYSHEDRLMLLDLGTGRTTNYGSPIAGRLVRTPAVSPDGRRIIFQVFRDGAWLLDVDTGSMRRVLDDASAEEFTWDPGGHRVAFHSRNRGGWGIWVMAPRTQ